MSGEEQNELPNMPEKDALYKEGQKYLYAKDKYDVEKGNLDIAKEGLVEAMKKAQRSTVTVDGKTMTYNYKSSESISVK